MTEENKEQPKEEKTAEPDVIPEPKEEKTPEPPKEKPAEPAKEDKKIEKAAPEDKPPKEEKAPEDETIKEEKKAKEGPKEEEKAGEKPSPGEAAEEKPVEAEKPKEKKEPAIEDKEKPEPKETPEKPPEKPKEAPQPKETKKPLGIPAENLLLFGKYDVSEVVVNDAGLARYINLDPVSVPHSGAKHANRPFAKAKISVVERLVNNMMRTEDNTGKKTKTYRVVMKAFDIINSKTKKNPVQVFIEAIENSTPREEVTRLRYGGVSVPKAVDTSSARRLDVAIRNICKGTVSATHKNTKPVEVCLANEIMLAAKGDMNSFAVAKKEELERIASSAR